MIEKYSLEETLRRIDEIEQLEDNWDGYGASKIDKDVIVGARKFARILYSIDDCPFCYTFPTCDERIQFEAGKGRYEIEVEIMDSDTAYYLTFDHEHINASEEGEIPLSEATDVVKWLIKMEKHNA